jgi:insertion element IS1 protein InsB
VVEKMITCKYCNGSCIKDGFQKNGQQRYKCKLCKKRQQLTYRNQACNVGVNNWIIGLVKESCGIRSIARLLKLAINTIIKRIKQLAAKVKKPPIALKQASVEVDEIRTFVGTKRNTYWVAYALSRQTGTVIDYIVGKRTKRTLGILTKTLLLSQVKKIYTDRLTTYQKLIPKSIHFRGSKGINHIERYNLNLRTHLKRLSRRTICFSRSAVMLNACLRIYFWLNG